ncbi:F0F1 ATP synthase subunit delta [Candidatus Karelsulcia muelleri]|uniref:F0F1 ATP synthase subunit delta n=1 Tax=Candidatus Karelsulcia muelleri TaxID=336810 RepID=UPI000D7C3399|nr:F0F1 ATP synthase subunit delta [Candidatus Karelsulcia muelleri]
MKFYYKILIKKYAKGFLYSALELKKEIFIKNEIEKLLFLIKKNHNLEKLLLTPFLKKEKKINFFKKIIKSNLIQNLLLLIIIENKEFLFQKIFLKYIDFFKKKKNIIELHIRSKNYIKNNSLNFFLYKKILFLIKNKIIIFFLKKKKNILGGFLIKFDNKYYDLTIKNFFKNFKQNLLK